MSTGAPVSGVDVNPPASNRTGHSRSRGHSRSTRYGQVPSPISLPSSGLHSTPAQPVQPLGAPAYPNGHASHPSWHGHHHSHSHSSGHFDPWMPSPANDAFHDHGIKDTERDTPATLIEPPTGGNHEMITGFLITVPWIALSWLSNQYVQPTSPDSQVDDLDETASNGDLDGVASKTCALTAGGMILFGCGQIMRRMQHNGSSGISDLALPEFSGSIASSVFVWACSIGLPIYAGLRTNGFLVAFALSLAFASGIPTISSGNPRERFGQKKATVGLLLSVVLLSFLGLNAAFDQAPFLGYVALLISVFVIRPPFPVDHSGSTSEEMGPSSEDSLENASVNILSGLLLALATLIISGSPSSSGLDLFYFGVTAGSYGISLLYSSPSGLRSPQKFGHAAGTGAAALLCAPPLQDDIWVPYVARTTLAAASFLAARFDDKNLRLATHSHNHHSHHHHHHSHSHTEPSKVTKMVLRLCGSYPLLHSIVKENDSRRIFYFMLLNFSFMMVQLSYGFLTGSLGLLSDSIHMFFDCLALVVGLWAAVMSKWPPSSRFPYGYGKVDTLSGFANGIFLMIISIEIIYEAVERLSSGSEMHRIGELLIVSVAGLLVNLVGIMAFDHGHAHGHDHGHDHSHGNENMHGIFLHILADTLGSVAVVISTVLVHFSGWAGYDPIASCLIAILIFASAIPLVTSTAKTLLLTIPADVEYNLRDTLGGVSALRGVVGYTVPKFWLDDTNMASDHDHHGHDHGHDHSHDHSHSQSHSHSHSHSHHDHDHDHGKHNPLVLGVIHVIASRGADPEDVRQRTIDFLREKNMDITVQVEREGDGRCWCGGGNRSS